MFAGNLLLALGWVAMSGHFDVVFPRAGGANRIPGDYLFRDYSPSGNRNGQFGILRVE